MGWAPWNWASREVMVSKCRPFTRITGWLVWPSRVTSTCSASGSNPALANWCRVCSMERTRCNTGGRLPGSPWGAVTTNKCRPSSVTASAWTEEVGRLSACRSSSRASKRLSKGRLGVVPLFSAASCPHAGPPMGDRAKDAPKRRGHNRDPVFLGFGLPTVPVSGAGHHSQLRSMSRLRQRCRTL
jgi:hypothetical protein